jgi:plasmid stabilization system protein ParE
MMTVVLRPRASQQLELLRPLARSKLVAALRVLAHVPRSGRPYSGLVDTYSRSVRIRRNWSDRVVYKLRSATLFVEYFEPAWMPRELF